MSTNLAINSEQIARLVCRQRDYFARGDTLPFEFRRKALNRLRAGLISYEKPLLEALHADLRKPPQEAYGAEIGLVLSEINYALKHLKRWMKPRRSSVPWMIWPARARVERRPLGVSLIVGPWNFPVQLSIVPLIGAIAGGNCAVIKPSEFVPATSQVIAEMLRDAFADQHVACVEGDRTTGEVLLRERFDHIFFTGGTAGGRAVAEAGARHLIPVTLELGGKCPVIVCADADLKVAAKRIIWAKTMNAGQVCVGPDYLFVHRSVRDPLIREMIAAIATMFSENVQKSPDFGRIVNLRHFERLKEYLKGAAIITGGQTDADDRFIAPTLIDNPPSDAPVMSEEIFGPILPVMTFDELSEALAFVKTRPSPLAVYLFTSDSESRRQVEQQLSCGGICFNDLVVQLFGKQLPFGGVGGSGMGNYHGKSSFDCFTRPQSVVACSTRWDSDLRYAPTRLSLKRYKQIVGWLLRG